MERQTRIALITGAGRGLGAVVARVLAGRGYDLVLGARGPDPLAAVADALGWSGRRVRTVPGDVTDPRVQARLVDEAERLGGLDVLVNNASELGGIGPLRDYPLDRFERIFRTNVIAPLALVQRALRLLERSGGLVVNVSSDAAQGGYPGWGGYGATKSALELVARTLAAEHDAGPAFVVVDPGDMRTRMHQEAFPGEDISDRARPDVTAPFWDWLLDQDRAAIAGKRFAAQQDGAPWRQAA